MIKVFKRGETNDPSYSTLVRSFSKILESPGQREQTLHTFIEKHTQFLLTPFLLNHGLHFNAVISKMPIGSGLITDFAYLTKSSVTWRIVLVELEKPSTRLFQADTRQVTPHSDFTKCLSQVAAWRDAVDRDRDGIIERVSAIRKPLARNHVEFKYVLIAGRSPVQHQDQRIPDRLRQLGGYDLQILSYDSLLRNVAAGRGEEKNILCIQRMGFRMKYLNVQPGQMLNYVFPHELSLDRKHDAKLMAWGMSVSAWRGGRVGRPPVAT